MLPQIDNQMKNETNIVQLPSKTYKLNISNTDNLLDYKELLTNERITRLYDTTDEIFEEFQIQGETTNGTRTIQLWVMNNENTEKDPQMIVFTMDNPLFRKDDIYDYLSDDGIVYRLEKVNNELVVRETPLIIPYTDTQQIVYNQIKNLHGYYGGTRIYRLAKFYYKIKYKPKFTGNDRIIGFVDKKEAIKQAIYHILNIERYAYLIYDSNYGVELNQYIGKDLEYIKNTIETTLQEALTHDLRITDVKVNKVEKIADDQVLIKFTVTSIYGDLQMEVNIDV